MTNYVDVREYSSDYDERLCPTCGDDALVKRDPGAIGTLNEHTRVFLTNIMGSEAHHPPSEVAGSEVHAAQVKLGETESDQGAEL